MTMYDNLTSQQRWIQNNRDTYNKGCLKYYHTSRKKKPWQNLYRRAKERARAKDIPFDIDSKYLESIWNDVCPILGIPLEVCDGKAKDCSPSLDRIDPERGYVKGNVVIVSQRANMIKNCGTLEEHRKIVSFLESQHT